MSNSDKNSVITIRLTAEEVLAITKEYYEKYEDFKGTIDLNLYSKGCNDGWGFTDYYGRVDFIFKEKIKIGSISVNKEFKIEHGKIPLKRIFQPLLEEADLELTGSYYYDMDVTNYGSNVKFNGLVLYAKK